MSPVVETLRRMVGKSSDLADRVLALEQAADAADGRLDAAVVDDARAVVERAAARLRLSGDHTVVGLAGATGSGKSSIFNALCGLDLSPVGVKRPTSSWTLACAWGADSAAELLDWLGIPKRHQISRTSMLDDSQVDRDLDGLVLLDLPDHDSTEVAHHLEVGRLVHLADVLVWVLDPQKYADAAVHDRFLRPLNTHADVMMVVLNHVDEIPGSAVDETVADVERLLKLDGLENVPVLATSATRGDGMRELRSAITERVVRKRSVQERLAADVKAMAARIDAQTGSDSPGHIGRFARDQLIDACADAAGVPVVTEAIESASYLRAKQATGWPVTKWLSRFRPDPLKRLHLDGSAQGEKSESVRVPRSSLPQSSSVQRARVDLAVRSVVDRVTEGVARPWATAIRSASTSRVDDFADALDRAVAATDLAAAKPPRWWRGVRMLQWAIFALAVAGGVWLAGLAAVGYLQLPDPPTYDWRGIPVPTLLLVGGVLAGLAVAGVSRLAARQSARRRAGKARARLLTAIEGVADDLVVSPVEAEVAAFGRCRAGVSAALDG